MAATAIGSVMPFGPSMRMPETFDTDDEHVAESSVGVSATSDLSVEKLSVSNLDNTSSEEEEDLEDMDDNDYLESNSVLSSPSFEISVHNGDVQKYPECCNKALNETLMVDRIVDLLKNNVFNETISPEAPKPENQTEPVGKVKSAECDCRTVLPESLINPIDTRKSLVPESRRSYQVEEGRELSMSTRPRDTRKSVVLESPSAASAILFIMDKDFKFSARIRHEKIRFRFNTASCRSVWTREAATVKVGGVPVGFTRGTYNSLGLLSLVKRMDIALIPKGGQMVLMSNPPTDLPSLACRSKRIHSVGGGRGSVSVAGVTESSKFKFVSGSSRIELGPLAFAKYTQMVKSLRPGACSGYPTIRIRINNLAVSVRNYVRRTRQGCEALVRKAKSTSIGLGGPFLTRVVTIWKRDGSVGMCVP